MNAALQWAAQHSNAITPPLTPTATEQRRLSLGAAAKDDGYWKGLVLVHAQQNAQKVYSRHGFRTDETMGVWDEVGIPHVGMWKRIDLQSAEK